MGMDEGPAQGLQARQPEELSKTSGSWRSMTPTTVSEPGGECAEEAAGPDRLPGEAY